MELTQEQIQLLRDYKQNPDDDNIRIKNIAKQILINEPLILYLLNNKELEDSEADNTDYLKYNILNNYLIHPTQHNVSNFICLGTECAEQLRHNDRIKIQRIIFYVLCEEKTNIEKLTGFGRHDLISAIIIRLFNWSNVFGNRCILVEDHESVTDNDYATRTLVFEMDTDNNLSKTFKGTTMMNSRNIYAKESNN